MFADLRDISLDLGRRARRHFRRALRDQPDEDPRELARDAANAAARELVPADLPDRAPDILRTALGEAGYEAVLGQMGLAGLLTESTGRLPGPPKRRLMSSSLGSGRTSTSGPGHTDFPTPRTCAHA